MGICATGGSHAKKNMPEHATVGGPEGTRTHFFLTQNKGARFLVAPKVIVYGLGAYEALLAPYVPGCFWGGFFIFLLKTQVPM